VGYLQNSEEETKMKVTIVEEKPVPPPRKVVIEMTIEEAKYIRALAGGLTVTKAEEAARVTLGSSYRCPIDDILYKIYRDFDLKELR
jgi:hypothetical protein